MSDEEEPPLLDAYAAGLFDGEGWVSPTGGNGHGCYIGIAMTNAPIIRALYRQFGGEYYGRPKYSSRHKPTYAWHLYVGEEALLFLNAVRPYVRVKREQIEIALAWIETIDHSRSPSDARRKNALVRQLLSQKLRELNFRGDVNATTVPGDSNDVPISMEPAV